LEKKGRSHLVLFYGYDKKLKGSVTVGPLPRSRRVGFSAYGSEASTYRLLGSLLEKDDILVCNDGFELAAVNYLRCPNKIVFILHGDLDHYNSLLRRYAGIIDGVLCVSGGLKDKYSTLYSGLSFEVCHPLVRNVAAPQQTGMGLPLMGVYAGRLEYMKGGDTFVDVVNTSSKEVGIDIRWEVYTTTRGTDKELLAALPQSVKVCYDIANDVLLDRLAKADFLVFPSRSEGFGMTVLEAMVRGVIPIARPLPIGIPDMVVDGETGYLADTAAEIVRIIKDLCADNGKRDTIRKEVHRLSNSRFNYMASGERFLMNIAVIADGSAREKAFLSWATRRVERYLPEFAFRMLKFMNNAIKYGAK
jgi:glycosyltransferase involved in cell wall biosynthesis